MTMYITPAGTTAAGFSAAIAAAGWTRSGDEAFHPGHRHAWIRDIDRVPATDGSTRTIFEARTNAASPLVAALGAIGEDEPSFWEQLGIEIQA